MKKSLFAAFMSALMMFVCSADLKAAPIPRNGYPTAEAAAEALLAAQLNHDVDAYWNVFSPRAHQSLIRYNGSEYAAKEKIKNSFNDPKVSSLTEELRNNSEKRKEFIQHWVKRATVVNGRYYLR